MTENIGVVLLLSCAIFALALVIIGMIGQLIVRARDTWKSINKGKHNE